MWRIMGMDKMIGGQFEKGLAELKAIVEAAPAAPGMKLETITKS